MVTVQLKGRITENGKLEVELPEGLPEGEVQVTLEVASSEDLPWELRPWTEEELAELMRVEPKTGAEIVAEIEAGLIGDGWSHVKVSGAEWVEEQRRKRKERRGW
jgi:hypothetical protein